ncbi:MAG TPA: DHA2 family efflux MFS transporter permease subunit [Microlunatus sp.]|nr:DHA2 family efflux MFS transporter permease subunit [Microlunatus sp.]
MSADTTEAAVSTALGTSGSAPAAGAVPVGARGGRSGAATPATASSQTTVEHWVVPLAVLIAGMFMSILDTSIVNVAVATIQTELGGSTSDVQWISTAYSLVLGVVVPASAWLGTRFGLSRVYMFALAAFALGSALCGLAWSLNSLIAFRVIQAIPGGLLPAITLTMVYRIVPRRKIGTAMGMYGLGIIFAPAIGPALGGYLVEYVNWRLVFYINVPIGIIGLIAAMIALPRFPGTPTSRFDVWGFVTVATGLVSLLLAFSEGTSWGWTSYRTMILITLGVLSLALFVVIELEVDHPLLDLRVFKIRAYSISLIVMSVMMTGMFATLFYIPLFLQSALGYGALEAGLLILPQALVMGFLTPIAGRLYDRVGPRWLVFSGLLIASFGTYLLSGISPDVTQAEIVAWTCIRSVGVGLSMMSIMTGGISALPHDQTTSGSAINTVVQRVSAALGLAGLTVLATTQQAQLAAARSGLVPASAAEHLRRPEFYAAYQQVRLDVFAQSLSNVFLLTTVTTLVAAVIGLALRSGPQHHDDDGPVMME